jgi:4-hydroxy-4-methyl-2-oxoglutarate aldolase
MRDGCACIVDAMGRLHPHRAHILDLVTPTPGRLLFGRAATISYVPVRLDVTDPELHTFSRHF